MSQHTNAFPVLSISFAAAFLCVTGLAVLSCKAQEHQADAGTLIDSIIAHQKTITGIHAKYHHQRFVNNSAPSEYQGTIDYQAPHNILMHFLFPANEYVLVDDSTILMYGVENAFGIRYTKKCLSSAENQIADQIGQIKMNLLETMRSSYTFSFADTTVPDNFQLSAKPIGGWKALSKINITVDPTKLILKNIRIYGKAGNLVSSTTYTGFIFIPNLKSYFPRTITISLVSGPVEQRDVITYSRLDFSGTFPKNHFSIPLAKNAKIKDNRSDCK